MFQLFHRPNHNDSIQFLDSSYLAHNIGVCLRVSREAIQWAFMLCLGDLVGIYIGRVLTCNRFGLFLSTPGKRQESCSPLKLKTLKSKNLAQNIHNV